MLGNAKLAVVRPELGGKHEDSSTSQHPQQYLQSTAVRSKIPEARMMRKEVYFQNGLRSGEVQANLQKALRRIRAKDCYRDFELALKVAVRSFAVKQLVDLR